MTVDPPGTPPAVRISPVIQAVIRAAVPDDLYDRAARAAADALLEVWPRDEPRSRLAADLRACAVSLRQAAGDVLWADGRCHPLLVLAGQSMDSARLTGPAVAYWRELAADSERILGPGSLETLMVTGYLGEALMAAGQAAEAVSWFQRVLDGRAERARARSSGRHRGQGLPRPRPGGRRPARRRRRRPGGGGGRQRARPRRRPYRHPRRAGGVRRRGPGRGKVRRGDPLVPALAGRPGAHPGRAASRHHVGQPRAGRTPTWRAARPRTPSPSTSGFSPTAKARSARTIRTRSRPAAASPPANFAAGRMGAALQLYEETCAGYERTIGADHPSTLACQAELARGYYATGRLGDAMTLLSDIIARGEQALPRGRSADAEDAGDPDQHHRMIIARRGRPVAAGARRI